jgi:hypothetical protein
MRQIQNRFPQDTDVSQTLERELKNMEYCRMRLAAPDNTPTSLGKQFTEFERLKNAQELFDKGNVLECLAQCNRLANLRNSLVGTACARIISAQLKTTVLLSSRKNALQLGYNTLEELKNGDEISSCQPG